MKLSKLLELRGSWDEIAALLDEYGEELQVVTLESYPGLVQVYGERSPLIKGRYLEPDRYYILDMSSLYLEDWMIRPITMEMLDEIEMDDCAGKLKEIYNYSDEEVENLKLYEEIN